jgi:hypothetical protein
VNQANQAANAYANMPDDCSGGGANQPATYFFQNGDKGGWLLPNGSPTSFRTLGHGYSAGNGGVYYGKCGAPGVMSGVGAFPGEIDSPTRNLVCACL